MVTNRVLHGDRTEDGRFLIVCTKETEWGMGGDGAFVRRNRSGGWEVSECLSDAVGEKSIDFLKKLYRLFPDTSIEPLRQYGSNDLIAWENRSVLI